MLSSAFLVVYCPCAFRFLFVLRRDVSLGGLDYCLGVDLANSSVNQFSVRGFRCDFVSLIACAFGGLLFVPDELCVVLGGQCLSSWWS